MKRVSFLLVALCVCCFLFIASCKNATKHHRRVNSTDSTNMASIARSNNANSALPEEGDEERYQYNLHPSKGKKYNYTIITETNTQLEVEDKKVKTGNQSEIGLIYEVLRDSANNPLIRITYNKLHIVLQKTDEEDQVIDADNAITSNDDVEKLLNTIKGSSITLTLNTKGDIVKVSGSKEISDKIMANMKMDDLKTKQLAQNLINKLTGEGFIQNNLKEGFRLFPDTAVYVGDSWNRTGVQNGEISFEATSTYTLAALTDKIATIEVAGQISSIKNATTKVMGQDVTTDLTGEQTSTFKTDTKTGMLLYGKTNTSIKGTIAVVGREVPVTIKMKKETLLK
jgi:hypothetical protein